MKTLETKQEIAIAINMHEMPVVRIDLADADEYGIKSQKVLIDNGKLRRLNPTDPDMPYLVRAEIRAFIDEKKFTFASHGCCLSYDPTAWGVEKLLEPEADAADVDDLKQTREWKPTKKAPAVRVDVVAASAALMDANMDVAADTVNDQVHRLQERLAAVSDAYKYAVIDCGLLLDMAVLNALVAADLWIVPVKPGGFEVDGLLRVHEQLEELRQLNDGLELWVLPVMFGKSNAHKAVMAHLHTLGHRVTLATIRRSVIAESYTAAALPLPVYSPRCGVAKDYEALAYEVMAWNDEREVKA